MPTLARTIRTNLRHKVTVRLSPDAFSTAQEAVELGISPNQNAFIEDAIRLRARGTACKDAYASRCGDERSRLC